MSEVRRYEFDENGVCYRLPDGPFVSYDDYARLKAEVEQLRIERNGFEQAMKANQSILETKRDQVDRLRKAGDAMAEEIIGCYRAEGYDPADSETLPKWNAAKEGKPSV